MKGIMVGMMLLIVLSSAQCQSNLRPTVENAGLPEPPEASAPAHLQGRSRIGSLNEALVSPADAPQQTKRIFGIIPNFRSVSADTELHQQSAKEKVETGLEDSFDYSAFVFVGIQAGISQGTNSYPAFHQGASGFGRYYWHSFADQADENLLVESALPAALHEDSRHYTLGHGGFLKRVRYSFTRSVVTRTDSGDSTFNFAEVFGSGAAAGVSSTYYPAQYRTWTKTGQRWLTNFVLDGATFVAKEFWPDINHAVFRHKD